MTSTKTTASHDPQALADFDRHVAAIEALVAELNADLGLTLTDNPITFGYIGDLNGYAPGTPRHIDSRSFFVFLPHPGRVGTAADRIGGFAYGDAYGSAKALRRFRTFAAGARFGANPTGLR
jgi:hypothetical protein